jgi:biopolymer transport protein TolR
MGMGGGGDAKAMSDINVTPLVDVMLVLLIIFMITAPMMNNSGIDIDLPKEQTPALDRDVSDQLIISIDADLNYYINDSMFPKAEMGVKLAAIAKANPDQPVFLEADGSVPYREVAALLADAKGAGMPRVGLVFDPTGAYEEDEDE